MPIYPPSKCLVSSQSTFKKTNSILRSGLPELRQTSVQGTVACPPSATACVECTHTLTMTPTSLHSTKRDFLRLSRVDSGLRCDVHLPPFLELLPTFLPSSLVADAPGQVTVVWLCSQELTFASQHSTVTQSPVPSPLLPTETHAHTKQRRDCQGRRRRRLHPNGRRRRQR